MQYEYQQIKNNDLMQFNYMASYNMLLCGHLQGGINKNTITTTKVSEPFHH